MGFLSGLTGWVKWLAIGAVVVAVMTPLVAGVLYVRGSEQAKAELLATRQDLADEKDKRVAADKRARDNALSLEQCAAVNEANAALAELQRSRAINAEMRLAIWEANANRDVESIDREAETFRERGLDCPALDNDFRQWVREHQ